MSKLILGRSVAASRGMGFAAQAHVEAGELVTYSGDGHLITFAPTRTGKTSGPVITNALTHPGQLIVLDMKGEVFAATAKARRAMGQDVCVVDLRDGSDSGSLNPLDLAARCGTDPARLAADRVTLILMCRAITEAFAALRSGGTRGAPRNLAVLHSPLLRPVAVRYWAATMRSPMGEWCFAAHCRHAETEMRALGRYVAARAPRSPAVAELLGP